MKGKDLLAKNDAFVKKAMGMVAPMGGHDPRRPAEMERFNAYMSNNGMKSKEAARDLTKGLDKKAFPVS